MTTDTWHTYADAAALLGMTVEGVRQRARRESWRRTVANDGRARVLLPPDTARVPAGGTGDAGGETPGNRPRHRPEAEPTPITSLQAQISALEVRAAELRADLDREWAERLEERNRAERLVEEVASLARQLVRVVEESAGRERTLRDQVAAATRP